MTKTKAHDSPIFLSKKNTPLKTARQKKTFCKETESRAKQHVHMNENHLQKKVNLNVITENTARIFVYV